LATNLRLADQLPTAIYTPSSKAAVGAHDENIDFAATQKLIGTALAEQIREISLRLYTESAAYALQRGIIIADTKFEFGLDEQGQLHLIDEILTPDSSRFWPVTEYQPGISPPSFDKQIVRDYLETLEWDKTPPGPELPAEVIAKTAQKYHEAERLLTEQ
jgi:phosphoribosylaminoimidazole-succinocarboxamide synthase